MLELKKFIYTENLFIVPYLGNISFRKSFSGWFREKVSQKGRHEFYLITNGSGLINIGRNAYNISKGDLIYIPAESKISYDLIPGQELLDYFSINLSCALASHIDENWLYDEQAKYHYQSVPYSENQEWSLTKSTENFSLPFVRSMPNPAMLQNLLSELYHLRNDPDNINFWLEKNLLQRFLFEITSQNQITDTEDMNTKRIYKLTSYIKKHYMEPLSLDVLGQLVSLSPSYVIGLFNQYISQSPMAYVNFVRIEAAKDMLLERSHSISEIAALSGYQDVFYFSKKFKKSTGMTPRQYRQNLP